MNSDKKLVVILGPTAVGKTKFAASLAHQFNGEVISADSRQVYIGMDIGTGKDLDDYEVNGQRINYHLIDVVKPECEFNLYLFTKLFHSSFNDIINRKKLPFLVGGTGLYLSSILQKYSLKEVNFNSERARELISLDTKELNNILKKINPNLHNTTDLLDKERIVKAILIAEEQNGEELEHQNIDFLIIGLNEDREVVKDRIRKRLKMRMEEGMIEEVQKLLDNGISHEKLRFFGLEYKFLSMYLKGELNLNDTTQKLVSAIVNFSKRQMTWFRKMEKEGIKINWVKNNQMEHTEQLIRNFISRP